MQYSLCLPEYLTKSLDNALVTGASNLEANPFQEGQLRVTVRDGFLHFLFENNGPVYHVKSFEMLAVLEQHCYPDTVSYAFTTLMSLFKNVQEVLEEVLQFFSWIDRMIMDMACS
jgi:hypothetical protein